MIVVKKWIKVNERYWIGLDQKVKEFNNAKHNKSLMRYIEIFIIYPLTIVFLIVILFIGNYINKNHSKQGIVFTKIVGNIIFGIVVPLYILFKRKRIRKYMWMEMKNIFTKGWEVLKNYSSHHVFNAIMSKLFVLMNDDDVCFKRCFNVK